MNEHVEKAMKIRNECPVNCAQAVMLTYAQELGLTEEMAAALGSNFGGGMKCGKTCGAITAALMVLGAKGVDSPTAISGFMKKMAANHNGLTDCADLLKLNAQNGGQKKPHCDNMICEAIELMEEYLGSTEK